MVHAKDDETQKLERHSRNIKGCHERLRVNRDDLAKELEKDKHDRKKPIRDMNKTGRVWRRSRFIDL